MAKKPKGVVSIDAYDIGGKIKYAQFEACNTGHFWPVDGPNFKMQKTVTPHDVPAHGFMEAFKQSLSAAGQWRGSVDLRAVSICGPVVNTSCLRLVNRGILEPFNASPLCNVVLNDAMAALVGSLVAGVAKGHRGAVCMGTLGTGFGGAGRYWVTGGNWREQLMFEDHEMHFPISTEEPGRKCNCGIENCAEATVNEGALVMLLYKQKLDPNKLIKEGKPSFDAGRDLEIHLNLPGGSPYCEQIEQALDFWHRRLARVTASLFGSHVMGGDDIRPPALFVFGGGLARFIDADKLRKYVLELSCGHPQNGTNFKVCCENKLENRAGVIGAAAAAVMRHCGCELEDVEYLPNGSGKEKKAK